MDPGSAIEQATEAERRAVAAEAVKTPAFGLEIVASSMARWIF